MGKIPFNFSTDHLRSGLKTRALRGASLTVVGQGLSFVIQTIGTIALARLLTPHDFGLVTMVLTFGLLLGNFGVNGFTEAIIQIKEINHKQISTIFWINVGSSILLALLFIASSSFMVWFYKEPKLKSIIIVIAVSNVVAALSVQHLALLKRRMEFYKLSANDVIAAITSIAIPIVLAWWGWGYWALVAKWVISPLMITIGAWIFCKWRPGLPARRTGVRPILRYAFHTYGNFIMSYFRRNIDKMLIGRSFGSQPLGYYDRAYQLSNMLPNQIITPLYSVAVSTFSRLSDDPEKYRHHYLNVLSMLAFVGMPLSMTLTLNSHDIIFLLLGPQWSEADHIFLAFGVSIGVMILYITHGWLHLSLGTPDRWFRWSIIEFIVTIICFMIGRQFGVLGVAIAFSASFYILIGPALWYAGKPIQLNVLSVVSSVWKYFASAYVAGLLSWFTLYYYEFTSHIFLTLNIFIRIILSVTLCLSVYIVLIIVLHQSIKPISQFIFMLREIFPKRSSVK